MPALVFDDMKGLTHLASNNRQVNQPSDADLAQFYAAFSERFRGPSDVIKRRLAWYARFLSHAGGPPGTVLDLGVGRGEWMELVQEAGWKTIGVDNNFVFVSKTRARGFEVIEADALEHLERSPPASLGAVTAFHLVEHLTSVDRLRLMQGAFRALKPGGFFMLELPNIAHLRVAHYAFWLDPTHGTPLPGELLSFIAEYVGFSDVALTPLDDGKAVGFEALDLALTARKAQDDTRA